jgi:hypothetical protein
VKIKSRSRDEIKQSIIDAELWPEQARESDQKEFLDMMCRVEWRRDRNAEAGLNYSGNPLGEVKDGE